MRIALPMLLSLSLIACQKDAEPDDKPKGPPQPDDVIAIASVRSLTATLGNIQKYVDAVRPGSGAEITLASAASGLATAIGASGLEGIALDRPLHLIVLDPKKYTRPLLLLGHGDAAALRAGEAAAVKGKGGGVLVGDPAGVELCSAWALGSLFAEEAPAVPTIRASLRKLVERYRTDIDQARQSMNQAMTMASPGISRLLDLEIELMLRFASQTEEVRVVFDASATEASMALQFTPTKGSSFEGFNKAQRPAKTALLSRLPGSQGSPMLMASDYQLGPLRGVLFEMLGKSVASWTGSQPDEAFRRRFDALLDHFNGPAVVGLNRGIDLTGGSQHIYEVDDGPKTVAAIKAVFPWSEPATIDLFGLMKLQTTPKQAVATHDGVTIDGMTIRFDLSSMSPAEHDIMRQAYGDEVEVLVAGFDKHLVLVTGKAGDVQAHMQRAIDLIRRGPDVQLPAGARPALDGAVQRKATHVAFMNMTGFLAAMTGKTATASSGVTFELGFSDGKATVRIGMPAAHVREVQAAAGLAPVAPPQ